MKRRGGAAPLVLLLALGVVAGCDRETPGARGAPVLVSAAASLTDAFRDVAEAFEASTPGFDVVLNLGGSAALREQILAGAPADVFASADRANMERLRATGALRDAPRVFARNRLRIAVPEGNPAEVSGLTDLAREPLLIGLCAHGVPCGDLARRALARAGVAASIDTEEPNVRALLTKIEAGELDAGIVYATDIAARGERVDGVDMPEARDIRAEYPIAVLAAAPNREGAEAFMSFVLSDGGRRILARYGFESP